MKKPPTRHARILHLGVPLYTKTVLDPTHPGSMRQETLFYSPSQGFALLRSVTLTHVNNDIVFVMEEPIEEILPYAPQDVRQWSDDIGEQLLWAEVQALFTASKACLAALEGRA